MPGIPFEMNEETVDNINAVDNIRNLLSHGYSEDAPAIFEIQNEIDDIIYTSLHFTKTELDLIHDVLNYSLDFFQEGDNSSACEAATTEILQSYAQAYCDTINSIHWSHRAQATVFEGKAPLCAVAITFPRPVEVSP